MTYAAPANPGAYAAAALEGGVSAAQRKQLVANHKEQQLSYTKYLGAQEAGKELILYGVGNDTLAPLKKQYINFGDATIHLMIKHLHDKTAIKMTTSQKYDYKTEGYKKAWDPTMSITAYFTGLDRFMISLNDRGSSTSVEEKTMAAGARMWESEMFTEDQMVAWENKPAADQTWANLQTYFMEKWLERRQYSAATTKQSRFKEAALAAQKIASAEEEGEMQAMMFALLQDQHKAQIEVLTVANTASMNAMMEQMNAMLATNTGGRKQADKENTPPNKFKASIYDVTTTTLAASAKPVIVAPRCKSTGLWKLDLDAGTEATQTGISTRPINEAANAIFDLPNNCQTILYYHAAAGFPTKETFLDAIHAGNYATWPGLTTALTNKHFPDSDETQKGHMKGQRQGVRSTKTRVLERIVARERQIKIEPGTEDLPTDIRRHDDIFIQIMDLADTTHSDQTGTFPFTSQRGNRYIMVIIHVDAANQ